MQEEKDSMLNSTLSPLFTAQTDVLTLWIFKERVGAKARMGLVGGVCWLRPL